ncbi:MAG: hypothetical protein R2798_05555 [Chitinophagales bacterium]|nr:hypothetical protein [Bacteroidota bacterium]MCB9042615.1 hypothetical protein [Chitinophagales bacterium]
MKFFKSSFVKLPQHRRFNYVPRYYDPAKEAREDMKNRIRFEKGAFYKQGNNRLVGAFTEKDSYRSHRQNTVNRYLRMLYLVLMMGSIWLYLMGKIGGISTIFLLMVFMILFIRKVNA